MPSLMAKPVARTAEKATPSESSPRQRRLIINGGSIHHGCAEQAVEKQPSGCEQCEMAMERHVCPVATVSEGQRALQMRAFGPEPSGLAFGHKPLQQPQGCHRRVNACAAKGQRSHCR